MKKSSKIVTLATALTVGLGSAFAVAPSYAQDPGERDRDRASAAQRHGGHNGPGGPRDLLMMAQRLMNTFDTNEDGVLTQDEIDAVKAEELATYDADGDGTLSLEEFQALFLARVFEHMVDEFQRLDADGDGQITQEEFNGALANIVERLDRNDDGAVSVEDRPERDGPPRQ